MNDNNMTREPGGRDWLAALLLRQPDRFMPRFAAALARWQTLSRGFRRRFARRVAATAAGAALILALAGSPLLVPSARAATITVDGVTCTLIDAITAANTDTATGGCIAGDAGLDTIDLQADVTLTAAVGDYIGYTGLPAVTSEIVIEGNGFTIERDGAAPEFRILFIAATGDLTLNNVTISGGRLTSTLDGGGINVSEGRLQVYDCAITGNEAGNYGGGIANSGGDVTIGRSYFYANYAGDEGGGVAQYYGTMTILESTFTGNVAYDDGGAIVNYYGMMTIINSTFSGNEAFSGGAIYNSAEMTIINSTLTGNKAMWAGGIYTDDTLTLSRSIVSGNSVLTDGQEIDKASVSTIYADDYNIFSHAGSTTALAFTNFTPGASDIDASIGAADIPLTDILDTTLADNGGPTPTHNLVDDSPAVDLAPDADCVAPSLTGGIDQRGAARPFDVAGQGNDGTDTCDAGAVEFHSPVPGNRIFMSTQTAGTTGDGLAFGPEDIIMWDGDEWSMWFDGSATGLTPNGKAKHNINALFVDPDSGFILMSFAQNSRTLPGLGGSKIHGTDLVVWNGTNYILVIDGSDIDLNNMTQEKIDAVHLLPGSASPINGGACQVYLLISTQGPGRVSNPGEPAIKFGGEDVLGLCVTSNGVDTDGLWHMVLDGSAEGMPRNSTDSISVSDDGQTMYLTTRSVFNVDAAAGGHSMVYKYEFGSGSFSGPFFSAPANGLPRKVDGLQVVGELP